MVAPRANAAFQHDIQVVNLPDDPWAPGNEERCEQVVRAVCQDGFLLVENHKIDRTLINDTERAFRKVMALPRLTLMQYIALDGLRQRGFAEYGSETAASSDCPDLKEFWMVRDERNPLNPANWVYGPNIFPKEVSEFKDLALEYLRQTIAVSERVLACFEVFLKLERGLLTNAIYGAETVFRAIYYAALDKYPNVKPGSVRSAKHEDINVLTVLPVVRDLELFLPRPGMKRRVWGGIVIPEGADVVAINTGMMLAAFEIVVERLAALGLKIAPTTHRVVNPLDLSLDRVSLPTFVHFVFDLVLNSKGLTVEKWFKRVLKRLLRAKKQ